MAMAMAALPGHAGSLEKLLMPGELAGAHANIEDQCDNCHDRGDKTRQRALCLGCHDHAAVAADVSAKQGFHGRVAGKAQCNACHTEHKGRGADIVHLDAASFDHRRTDFPLAGAHVAATCNACHKAGDKFRDAPQRCVDCHRDDDAHRGKLGTDCAQCHEQGAFKAAKFDHGKTRFPLANAHAPVACGACHRDPGFKKASTRCVDCHAVDDVHRGSRGVDCASCHGTVEWKQFRFDHARAANYPLEGKHASIACGACHRGGDLKAPLPSDCRGCHAAADQHAGRFGVACADCHDQREWPIRGYDHGKHAEFALRGAHERIDCHGCHTGILKQQVMARDCQGCHVGDDVHGGSLGPGCQSCHRESGWRDEVRFDHDLAGFPLVGLHVNVPCGECHATRAYRAAPLQCVSCHRTKDVHKERLGPQCEACHNPNGWDFWLFDHGRQTAFVLSGAHARLGCRDCHRQAAHDVALPSDCLACHRGDDIHDGRFGRDCGRCHTSDSFSHATMN